MRYIRLFFLYFQTITEQKARSFVYFLLSLFSPLLMILFWKGAQTDAHSWSISNVASYYLLAVIVGSLLMAHIESEVAVLDIQEGGMSSFILKPFQYYWLKFFSEIPWRILQGIFGFVVFFFLVFIFHVPFTININIETVFLAIIICVFAYFLSFTYKMILGLVAFWSTDTGGFFNMSEMLLFLFAGYIIPLQLYPSILELIARMLPFSLMIYYPIIAVQGNLDLFASEKVILFQTIWLVGFICLYAYMWRQGLKKYTGVGQ